MNHNTNSKQRARLAVGACLALLAATLTPPAHASEDSFTSLYCVSEAQWEDLWSTQNAAMAQIRELYGEQGVTLPTLPEPQYKPAKRCITMEMRGSFLDPESEVYGNFDADRLNFAYNANCTSDLKDGSNATIAEGTNHTLDEHSGMTFIRRWTVPAGCEVHLRVRAEDGIKSKDYDPDETIRDHCKYWDFGADNPKSCSDFPDWL